MFKRIISLFVLLLTLCSNAWADVSWDFTNSNDHNLSKNGVTLSVSGWEFKNGALQARWGDGGATLTIPVNQGQTVTIIFSKPSNGRYEFHVSGAISETAAKDIEYTDSYVAQYIATYNGNIVITSGKHCYNADKNYWTSPYGLVTSLTIQDQNNVIQFVKNGNPVTSDVADFIGLNYQEPVLMGIKDGDVVTYDIQAIEGGSIASIDSGTGDLMFTNCGKCKVIATINRNGQTQTREYTLTIQADDATYEVDEYTYTLTGNGKLLENVVRNQVPKITMSFGNPELSTPNATMVRNNDGGSTPVATVLDQNGWRQVSMETVQQDGVDKQKPHQGSFYVFKPETSGLLTVEGFLNTTSNTAYFVDADNLAPSRESTTEYLTSLVDKTWGGIGVAGTNVAPAVETADGDYQQMREVYRGDMIFGEETPIQQTVTGLPKGTYKVVVYANAQLTTGRGVKQRNGTTDATECGTYVAAICCQNDYGNLGWITPNTGGSINQNQEIPIDNVRVTEDGTLNIKYLTNSSDDGTKGVNWITIQIKSIERMGGGTSTTSWTPLREISTTDINEKQTTAEIPVEKGHTYYLYGNTPSTNGGGWLTYQLHSFTFIPGISFKTWSYVLGEGETDYTQTVQGGITGVTYSGTGRGGLEADVDPNTGKVSNFRGDGGAIIVTATKGDESDFYVITKPYKTHKWTFTNMNYTAEGEDHVCDLANDFKLDGSRDWGVNYKVRTYNETTRNLQYINVPVMTNNTALSGENAAYIGATAGLVVEANSKCFGSNATVPNKIQEYNKSIGKPAPYEQDIDDVALKDRLLREMLQYTKEDVQHEGGVYSTDMITWQKGAKIIIPSLKAGQYVRVKWARYNDDKGEFIQVKNLADAEGTRINRNIRSWSVQDVDGKVDNYGYTVFKVIAYEKVLDNDNVANGIVSVSFEPQDKGWTNLYSIEVADEFENLYYIVSGEVPAGKVVTDTDLRLAYMVDNSTGVSDYAPTSFTHEYGKSSTYQFADRYKNRKGDIVLNTPSVPSHSQFGYHVRYSLQGLDGSSTLMPSLTANVTSNNGNGVKGRKKANGTPTATSITEGGLLTYAGQGQCVVVQKAYEGETSLGETEYVFDIQRTIITITQDVDITWDYPYTWDFTNISNETLTAIGAANDGTGNANWQKNADGSFKATDSFKNTFVQGGMLSSTDTYENLSTDKKALSGTGNRISEYEGLGFQTETNAASSATGFDVIGITVPTEQPGKHGGAGGMVIGNKETTIVVPDVPAGMNVYVRLEPQDGASVNVGGTTSEDFTDGNEKVYSTQVSEKGNVELKLKNVVVKGIAVSDFKKTCWFRNGETHDYFNTDSHPLPIDYTLTLYYTNNEILAYQVKQISDKVAALGLVEKGPENTGYVVSTTYNDDSPVQRPLFVPCANDIKRNMTSICDYSKNHLLPHVKDGKIEDGDRDTEHYDYYVLTNIYQQVNDDDELVGPSKTATVPGFYRVVSTDNSEMFRYRAYLKLPKSTSGSNVKAIPLFDFDGELVDAIDEVPAIATNGIDVNGTFYTLQGMKIQGLPKQGGVYIQNGKKVMVK